MRGAACFVVSAGALVASIHGVSPLALLGSTATLAADSAPAAISGVRPFAGSDSSDGGPCVSPPFRCATGCNTPAVVAGLAVSGGGWETLGCRRLATPDGAGAAGPVGVTGAPRTACATGAAAAAGAVGAAGSTGAASAEGTAGSTGAAGAAGTTGETAATVTTGATGATSRAGTAGTASTACCRCGGGGGGGGKLGDDLPALAGGAPFSHGVGTGGRASPCAPCAAFAAGGGNAGGGTEGAAAAAGRGAWVYIGWR